MDPREEFLYLDLVRLRNDASKAVLMVEDYTYVDARVQFRMRAKSGKLLSAFPEEIDRIGHLEWPHPFETVVRPTAEYCARTGLSFDVSETKGMSYDYVNDIWYFAISAADGTLTMAVRDDFEIATGEEREIS